MRKRMLLLPILVAALLAVGAGAAQAGTFVLTLTDVTNGVTKEITDNQTLPDGTPIDVVPVDDNIVFDGWVGSFRVTVLGNTDFYPASTAPVEMTLQNFLVSSTTGGQFTATLARTGISSPLLGSSVVGVATYGALVEVGTGTVKFQSWIDPADTGHVGDGTPVFVPEQEAGTGLPDPISPLSSAPVTLAGEFSLVNRLQFDIGVNSKMNANTALQVVNEVPEPTTLLLFGPGMFGLAALRRRFRSKEL